MKIITPHDFYDDLYFWFVVYILISTLATFFYMEYSFNLAHFPEKSSVCTSQTNWLCWRRFTRPVFIPFFIDPPGIHMAAACSNTKLQQQQQVDFFHWWTICPEYILQGEVSGPYSEYWVVDSSFNQSPSIWQCGPVLLPPALPSSSVKLCTMSIWFIDYHRAARHFHTPFIIPVHRTAEAKVD